jgi:hypothetical protein
MTLSRALSGAMLATAVLAAPAIGQSTTFFPACSAGAFKVCASAEVWLNGTSLVMHVRNLNQTPSTGPTDLSSYFSETGGWHTIRAVGVQNLGYTLAGTSTQVTARYFANGTSRVLSSWAGDADANAIQVYNTGADADRGHQEGIVGCFDVGPSNKKHVSTCTTGAAPAPYVEFTITGFSSLWWNDDAYFGFHGVQAAYEDCDVSNFDERCTGNSFKGAPPPTEVVPEPITMILLGSGLLGVGGAAARKRKKEGEIETA